jgi:hypothetical protein
VLPACPLVIKQQTIEQFFKQGVAIVSDILVKDY